MLQVRVLREETRKGWKRHRVEREPFRIASGSRTPNCLQMDKRTTKDFCWESFPSWFGALRLRSSLKLFGG